MANDELIEDLRLELNDWDPDGVVGPLFKRALDALEAAQPKTVSTLEELITLPIGSVLIGPDWDGEVYRKGDHVEFWAIASPRVWLAYSLAPRGPFTVLHQGGDTNE